MSSNETDPGSSATQTGTGHPQALVVSVVGAAVMLLGLVVMVGWHTHTEILIQVLPGFVPMQYNTALSFLLSGTGLLLLARGRPRLSMALGSVVGAIGFLALIEYLLGLHLGIDQLFIEHYITVETSNPGRMAPNAALCFLLTGVAFITQVLVNHPGRRPWTTGGLGVAILALGSVAFFGYLAGAQTAYGWGQLTRMAVHTSAGFMALSLGVITLALREGAAWVVTSGALKLDRLVYERRRIVATSVGIMVLASMAVGLTVIRELYSTGLDAQRDRLEVLVDSRIRMIEAVARFDKIQSYDVPGGAYAATLSQIVRAQEHAHGFGQTGEFTLARRDGEVIIFLVRPPNAGPDYVDRVTVGGVRAVPMQRALAGESGTVIGADYRGEIVVAAFAPVVALDLGIVAKTDLTEVRAPFIRSSLLTAGLALIIIAIGAGVTVASINPLVRRVEAQASDLLSVNAELKYEATGHQESVKSLREREALLTGIYETYPDIQFILESDGTIVRYSAPVAADLYVSPEAFLGKRVQDILPPEVASLWQDMLEEAGQREGVTTFEYSLPILGEDRIFECRVSALPESRFIAIARNITDRRQAEEVLQRQQRAILMNHRIANVFLASPGVDTFAGVLDVILEALESRFGFFGYIDDAGDLVCPTITDEVWEQCQISGKSNVFARADWGGLWGESLLEKRTMMTNEDLRPPRGHVMLENALVVPIVHHERLIGQFAVANKPEGYGEHDRELLESAAQQTAPVLHSRLEKAHQDHLHEQLEEQYRHAQRMEAVGQLAGGIAHDFNNLLQVIQGFGEIAMARAGDSSPAQGPVQEMLKASDRARTLVKQLLAFSRRQVLEMTDVDLNRLIADLMEMIRRVIGEHVRLDVVPGHNLGIVRADRGQLEQVLMNLCVNARDAMPEGGRITIEVENVRIDEDCCEAHAWATPGRYALFSVTDTGCGMDDETLDNIFEPFFTTKETGEGTGLGLATVYGLIKQHEGMIHVYSEIDKGTTFKVYLPMTERSAAEVGDKIEGPSPGGTETILVAEDDDLVLDLTKEVLEQAGYTVVTASDGEEAIRVFEDNADAIELALLDVVMPKLGGRAVFEQIRQISPQVRVLFASGYSMNAIHTNFVLDEGLALIQKPHRRSELLRKVREVLDQSK